MKRIYLDYAASTPIDPKVLEVMKKHFKNTYGNPGSLHSFGQEAIAALDKSRETVAASLGAEFREIIFTGSATEANNLALRGAVKYFLHSRTITLQNRPSRHSSGGEQSALSAKNFGFAENQAFSPARASSEQFVLGKNIPPKIIISSIEHESVMETARDLEREGSIELVILSVDKYGFVSPKKLESLLDERVILVSVMYANNEIGSIQPIAEISKIIGNWKLEIGNSKAVYPLLHTDAVQAFQYLDCNVNNLGIDLMTLSSHKIYGPKGVGVLFAKHNKIPNLKLEIYNLQTIITGGNQEFGMRSGTENVPIVAGFAEAVRIADSVRKKEFARIKKLKTYFILGLKKNFKGVEINPVRNIPCQDHLGARRAGEISNGVNGGYGENFLPNIINVYFPRILSEELLIALDMAGIAVSSGSACSARSSEPSRVLRAIMDYLPTAGRKENHAKHNIRFSMGKYTTKEELCYVVNVLKKIETKK